MRSRSSYIDAYEWLADVRIRVLPWDARGVYAEVCMRLSTMTPSGRGYQSLISDLPGDIISVLIGAGLLALEGDHIVVPSIVRRAELAAVRRENGRKGGNPALTFRLVNQEDYLHTKSATNKRKRKEYSPEFAKFWADYPHPQNPGSKLAASTAFSRLDQMAQADACLGIERLKSYAAKNPWYHSPMAATYLNQRRWEGLNQPESAQSPQSPMLAKYGRAAINGGQK